MNARLFALIIKFLLIALSLNSVPVQAQPPLSDAAFSRTFRCPESFPTDKDRKDDLNRFLRWAMERYPNLTVKDVVELRTRLLEEHHCERTLANIESSVGTANTSPRNLCTGDDRKKYFSDHAGRNCTPVPLNTEWVNFYSGPKVVVDIMPLKIVREADGAKIWAQFFLAESVASDDGRWRYDYVKGVTKYYCRTKQQLLIQGTYSLNGSTVFERGSTDSIVEEIEPGTLAEGLYEYVCKK
jgi:hypothetical protein